MKVFKVIRAVDGQRNSQVIDKYDNIDDARDQLYKELSWTGNDDWGYFADAEAAQTEIAFAEEAREDWGDERVDAYVKGLREGIKSGAPFVADSTTGECISAAGDSFRYDNYTIEIVEEEEITTLNELADYINACDDYNNAVVEEACERNGWEESWEGSDDTFDIASDGKEKVTFNDRGVAEVWPID